MEMSEEKPWINTCGLDLEGISRKKKKISLEDIIPQIENGIELTAKKLKDLRKFMSTKFHYVNEDSLISQEYAFLNPPKKISNIHVCAYHILQANMMAIVQLLKQFDKVDAYVAKLKNVQDSFPVLLCNVHLVLISEGFHYIDVTEDIMSDNFKNIEGSFKVEKHFIAIRQIQKNMNYLSDEYNKRDFVDEYRIIQEKRNGKKRKSSKGLRN